MPPRCPPALRWERFSLSLTFWFRLGWFGFDEGGLALLWQQKATSALGLQAPTRVKSRQRIRACRRVHATTERGPQDVGER